MQSGRNIAMLGETQKQINEFLSVEISEDKYSASLIIRKPDIETFKLITPLKIINILNGMGVKYGLKKDLINRIVVERLWDEKFLIAEAKMPVAGKPATLEIFFQTEKSLRPKIMENGQVDYREVCNVDSVEKDFVLLKKIPPTKGYNGKDVCGNELPAQMGKDLLVNNGKGTYWDENDSSLLKAAGDGIVFYDEKKNNVDVKQVYVVPSSVNYSTGNINVKSAVEIRGNVSPGFKVSTPYSVMVKGVVENAIINCKGGLKVGSGIIGENSQFISVGGDIHTGYINSQHIKCAGGIYVGKEIRNAYIECENEIEMTKSDGVIIGGQITAANKITAGHIGNSYNIHTDITVGINPRFRQELSDKRKELEYIDEKVNELGKKITYIVQHSPPQVLTARLAPHRALWDDCSSKLKSLKKEVADLEEAYYNTDDAEVIVTKTVHPGTTIRIKEAVFEVKEPLNHVKFVLEGDKVVFKNIKN